MSNSPEADAATARRLLQALTDARIEHEYAQARYNAEPSTTTEAAWSSAYLTHQKAYKAAHKAGLATPLDRALLVQK
jgi:hypothetical protein